MPVQFRVLERIQTKLFSTIRLLHPESYSYLVILITSLKTSMTVKAPHRFYDDRQTLDFD